MSFYVVAREEPLTIGNANIKYEHNERKNRTYLNRDVDLTKENHYFKKPDKSYIAIFHEMAESGLFSTRKVQLSNKDTAIGSEIIVAVAGNYFSSEKQAVEFFEVANAALNDYFTVKLPDGTKIDGKDLCISSVVHLDEGSYGLHYTTATCVAREKKKRRTKKQIEAGVQPKSDGWYCQLSHSGFWQSGKDENGKLYYSFSKLNDIIAEAYKKAGYKDIERGKKGSTAKHLHPNVYKALMNEVQQEATQAIEMMDVKKIAGKYVMDKAAYENLINLQNELATQQKAIEKVQELIDVQNQEIKENRYAIKKKELAFEREAKISGQFADKYKSALEEKKKIEAELLVKAKQIEEQREVIAFWEELAKWLIEAIDAIMQMINELFNDRTDDYRSEELKNSIQDYCNKIRLKISRIDFWREYR